MAYIDGTIAAVPTGNKDAYIEFSKKVSPIFKEHGALNVVECWGDDVPEGKTNSMYTATMCKPDETIVFSWITWPSKAVRDTGMAKVMSDPRISPETTPMPFDGQRMIIGGFETIFEA